MVQQKFLKSIILTAIFSLTSHSVLAKEYPVIGKTFEISERNMIDVIMERMKEMQASGEYEKIKKKMINRATNSFKNPQGVYIENATENRTRKYNPSIILNRDIKLPSGHVLYYAGTKVNPLEIRPLSKRLIFINGDVKAQNQFALDRLKESGYQDKIILVSGSPYDFMNKNNVRVYFDQVRGEDGNYKQTLVDKFGIKKLPSVVYQKNHNDTLLTIDEVALNEE